MAISGRHRDHYLWVLTQSYSAIPKNLRRQAKTIFVWYPKERADLKMIHDQNNVLTDDELVIVRAFLRTSKHACLYIYKMNILMDLMYWIVHEVIIFLSEPKKDSLKVVIHTTIYCDNHDACWIQMFLHQQTWPVLLWKIYCCYHIWNKCTTIFQGLPVVFHIALWHILPFPWLNQKQDVQKWDLYMF